MKPTAQTIDSEPENGVHRLRLGDLKRDLPIIEVAPGERIASFVLLGDTELVEYCGQELAARLLPWQVDCLLVPEGRALPLAHVVAARLSQPERFIRYIVVRKGVKSYMRKPLVQTISTVTTAGEQTLVLDGRDAALLAGRRVCVVDDLISTGGTIRAVVEIGRQAGATIACVAVVLLEGTDAQLDPTAKTGGIPVVWLGAIPTY